MVPPVKLEEQFKNKVQNRELQPSTSAWKKLEQRLDEADEKRKLPFWRYAIAASVIGVIIAMVLFNKDSGINQAPIVVENDNNEVIEQIVENDKDALVEVGVIESHENKALEKVEYKSKSKEIINTKSAQKAILNIQNTVSHNNQVSEITNEGSNNKSVQNIITELKEFENNNPITDLDAEVDALLKVAQMEIEIEQILKRNNFQVVDANLLLEQIETELQFTEASLKNKIFKVLKSTISEASIAFTERNKR